MNIDRLAKKFWTDGYLMLDNFFDATQVEPIDRLIRDHFGADPDFYHTDEFLEQAKTEVIPWFPQNEGVEEFDTFDANHELQKITETILGPKWQPDYCMVMFSKRGTSGQAWHQDCAPDDPSIHNLNRLIYTTDITDQLGGQTVVRPGSHKKGILSVGDPEGEFDDQLVLSPKKGTLIFLHGHTWHRVLPITGKFRYSTNYRAVPENVPKDVTDVCVYRNMRYRFSTEEVIETRS